MSASYLYHTHSIRGYKLTSTDYSGGEVVFNIERQAGKVECRECQSFDVTPVHLKYRDFVTLPAGKKSRLSDSRYIA